MCNMADMLVIVISITENLSSIEGGHLISILSTPRHCSEQVRWQQPAPYRSRCQLAFFKRN